jgi:hypothetical protein
VAATDTLPMVVACYVSMIRRDKLTHGITIEASSLFDAANQAIQAWARFWWFDPQAHLVIEASGKVWRVSQARVREWRASRP